MQAKKFHYYQEHLLSNTLNGVLSWNTALDRFGGVVCSSYSQGGITIIGANQEKTVKLPISFKKWYVPYSVIRYDHNHRPNINMMCTYAGIEDLSNIYLSTDIIRNEDIGVPLTVFWYASGI